MRFYENSLKGLCCRNAAQRPGGGPQARGLEGNGCNTRRPVRCSATSVIGQQEDVPGSCTHCGFCNPGTHRCQEEAHLAKVRNGFYW